MDRPTACHLRKAIAYFLLSLVFFLCGMASIWHAFSLAFAWEFVEVIVEMGVQPAGGADEALLDVMMEARIGLWNGIGLAAFEAALLAGLGVAYFVVLHQRVRNACLRLEPSHRDRP